MPSSLCVDHRYMLNYCFNKATVNQIKSIRKQNKPICHPVKRQSPKETLKILVYNA